MEHAQVNYKTEYKWKNDDGKVNIFTRPSSISNVRTFCFILFYIKWRLNICGCSTVDQTKQANMKLSSWILGSCIWYFSVFYNILYTKNMFIDQKIIKRIHCRWKQSLSAATGCCKLPILITDYVVQVGDGRGVGLESVLADEETLSWQ